MCLQITTSPLLELHSLYGPTTTALRHDNNALSISSLAFPETIPVYTDLCISTLTSSWPSAPKNKSLYTGCVTVPFVLASSSCWLTLKFWELTTVLSPHEKRTIILRNGENNAHTLTAWPRARSKRKNDSFCIILICGWYFVGLLRKLSG